MIGVNSVYVPAFTMSRIRCVSIRISENMCEIMNYYDYDKLQSIFLKQLNFMKRRKKQIENKTKMTKDDFCLANIFVLEFNVSNLFQEFVTFSIPIVVCLRNCKLVV